LIAFYKDQGEGSREMEAKNGKKKKISVRSGCDDSQMTSP
jgi:hypothetical protein